MMALKGAAAAHIHTYLSQVAAEERQTLAGLWKAKLEPLYKRESVRDWFSRNIELINDDTLRLADYLEEREDLDATAYLEISRVCEVPENLFQMQVFVDLYLSSDKAEWIQNCLGRCTKQMHVNVVTFSKVVRLLIDLQWSDVFRTNMHKIIATPFHEWFDLLTALTKEVSELKVEGITWQDTIADLSRVFGPVTQKHAYELIIGRTSRANMAIAAAKKKPNGMQEGIALYSAANFLDERRQLWQLPSGMGKSRIIPALSLHLLNHFSSSKVIIFTSHKGLLARDQEAYADYF